MDERIMKVRIMKQVPEYLKKLVNEMHGEGQMYSVEWLNEWLDTEKLREKYGADWKKRDVLLVNNNRAVGYMEAIGSMYLRKLEKLPEITGKEMEILLQEVSDDVNSVIRNTIRQFFLHQGEQEDC